MSDRNSDIVQVTTNIDQTSLPRSKWYED